MKIISLLSLLLFVSCATSYGPSGFRGGYSDQKLASDLVKVSFSGNSYTSEQLVEDYLLKRCAEITRQHGLSHFVVVNSNGSVDTSYSSQLNSGVVNTYTSNKHTKTAVIKMINNPASNVIAYDASVILSK